MEKDAKEALQVTKEIIVKFIETSRVSPTNFAEIFPGVFQVVLETITRPYGAQARSLPETSASGGQHADKGQGA